MDLVRFRFLPHLEYDRLGEWARDELWKAGIINVFTEVESLLRELGSYDTGQLKARPYEECHVLHELVAARIGEIAGAQEGSPRLLSEAEEQKAWTWVALGERARSARYKSKRGAPRSRSRSRSRGD